MKVHYCVLALALPFAACTLAQETVSMSIPVLTVCKGKGALDHLPFSLTRDESGRPLRILIADDTPNGSREGIRSSVWLAAMTVAMLKNDPLDGVRLTIEFSGDIDGPSAGGVICLAILQGLEKKNLPSDFAMTGTIMPDGTIGLVGGVALKIRAAIKQGMKRICIPAFERFEKQEDGTYVDLFRLGDEAGVKIIPVRTIEDVCRVLGDSMLDNASFVDEVEALSIPSDVDSRIVKQCLDYFGDKGPTIGDADYWDEVERSTGFQYWNADVSRELEFWSRLKRGKILAANRAMNQFRCEYGDFATSRIFDVYKEAITNEYAVTKEVDVGTNKWHVVADPPYDKGTREKMIAWNKWGRQIINEFDDYVSGPHTVNGFKYFPDERLTEIASQGENFSDCGAEAVGFMRYYSAYVSALKDPAKMSDDELRSGILLNMRLLFLIMRFCNNLDLPSAQTNRFLIYCDMPHINQSKKVLQCENIFYTASLSVARAIDAGCSDEAADEDVTQSTFVQWIDRHDPQYAILRIGITNMQVDHRQIQHPKSLTNYSYRVSAQLYRQSQILAKACALQVKFSPDAAYDFANDEIGNREFVQYLARMARQSAVRSISACKKAKIPCIDPILRVELGDEAQGNKDCDLIVDVLENYWRAHLGAKALIMGFEGQK